MRTAIAENNNQIDKDLKQFDELLESISNLHCQINLLVEKITDLYVYSDNQDIIERELQELELNVDGISDENHALIQHIQDSYSQKQGFVPSDISEELKSLELDIEKLREALTTKMREFKSAKTVRGEYLNGIDYTQVWLQQTELRIQDRTLEPLRFKELLHDIQKELTTIYEKLETVKQCAVILVDNIRSDNEKKLIQSTVEQLEKHVERICTDLEEKKHMLHDSLDAYARFMRFYENVLKWATEKKDFINISLNVITLPEARQKMNEYLVNIHRNY